MIMLLITLHRWWANEACLYRDGLLRGDTPTKGSYDIPTLPLFDGSETVEWPQGSIKYSRKGTRRDMWNSLITQTGKRVRVLRGYLLTSPFAPKVGIRYDGV